MIARELMKKPITCSEEETIQEAARLMADNQIGSLIVTKAGRLRGILTERDIMIGLAEMGGDVAFAFVKDMMTESVFTVSPNAGVSSAVKLMEEHKIKKLPVVDGDQLVGIITATDILERLPGKGAKLYEILKG